MEYSLGILIFLKRSLVFPILLFSSISLHCLLRKTFSSLLAIHWNSAFRWVYLSFYPFPFASLLFSGTYKASSDNQFALLHFFFLGMFSITASYTMLWISAHNSLGTLSMRFNPVNLSLSLDNYKGFYLSHTWMAYWFSLLSFTSEFDNKEFSNGQ